MGSLLVFLGRDQCAKTGSETASALLVDHYGKVMGASPVHFSAYALEVFVGAVATDFVLFGHPAHVPQVLNET